MPQSSKPPHSASAPRPGRPHRLHVVNELGRRQTLAAGLQQFTCLSGKGQTPLLFLGVGPEPEYAIQLSAGARDIYYIEAPSFTQQMPTAWHDSIPAGWHSLSPADAAFSTILQRAIQEGSVYSYSHVSRLFPSFWGSILAQAQKMALGIADRANTSKTVLLPSSTNALLVHELRHGFEACGMQVRELPTGDGDQANLVQALQEETPALFCSINFHGLDAYGERFHLLQAAGVPVAIWCVDNPWHLLSGLKTPFWRQAALFVTDASFIDDLEAYGATSVHNLPLAAWPEAFSPPENARHQKVQEHALFVGRASFPGKRSFFAGMHPPQALWREAMAYMESGHRPDYTWWRSHLEETPLWPGTQARLAGCCAEEASQELRLRCLRAAAAALPLQVYGDDDWQELLPELADKAAFAPPVDYYGQLPSLYNSARYTLNATSLLLPAGLTQRHFDVWVAGGFLLSDATPGLELFSQEITAPVTVDGSWSRPALERTLERLETERDLRKQLQHAWRDALLSNHTYRHRAQHIIECCSTAF